MPRLVTLDLDGTLLRSTLFQNLAEHVGGDALDAVHRFDELFFRGAMSLEACFYAEYDLFYDLPLDELDAALADADWVRGIPSTVAHLHEGGARVVLLTDQPRWACDRIVERYGLDGAVCTEAATRHGRVGALQRPNFEKLEGLRRFMTEGPPYPDVAHVGNGSNDVPIFEAVGRAVAFNPSGPPVEAAADAVVRSDDLRDVLPHLE